MSCDALCPPYDEQKRCPHRERHEDIVVMRQTRVWERGRSLRKQFERYGLLDQVGTLVPT